MVKIYTINPKATIKITMQRVIENKLTKEIKRNHKKVIQWKAGKTKQRRDGLNRKQRKR